MSTQPLTESAEPRIYRSVGVPTLLSRGWNLLRQNMKESMLVMLLPAVIGAVINIGMSIPAALPTLTSNAAAYQMAAFFAVGIGFIFRLLNAYVWMYCFAILGHHYYQTLVHGSPPGLRQSIREIRERALTLFLVFTLVGVLYAAFILMDVVFFIGAFVGIYVVIILAAVLVSTGGRSPNSALMGFLVILLFFLLAALSGLALIVLVSLQAVFCYLPVVAVANARPGKGAIFAAFRQTFRLLFSNFPRVMLFGFLMFVLSTTLSLAMSMPIQMWQIFELFFNRGMENGVVPFHVSVVSNIYSVLVGTIIWPFIFVSLTLLWYDCRVRSEGLDLRLALYRLNERFKERFGKAPRHTTTGESPAGE